MAPNPSPLRGRLAVVTGGSAGIGRALADRLSAAGASVIVGSRRPVRGRFEHRTLDLASQESVAAFADGLVRDGRPIDLLVLNAGVHVPWKNVTTDDGLELHWQVNHLSNFQLGHRLLDLCRRSTLKRVVYVASEAHRLAGLPAAPLLGFWYRYAKSKEAAVTSFLRLAELHPELTVRIVSPGYVDSEIHRHKSRLAAGLERTWSRPRAADAAAREILKCSDPATGASVYWDRGAPARSSGRSRDASRADALWREALAQLGDRLPGAREPQPVTNFARTFRALGPAIERPSSVGELADIVGKAAEDGKGVRIVGRRHSYNDGFFSPTCMVSLERLDRVLELDAEKGTLTCEAGISIGAVGRYLDERGYALRFCGNFGRQTLAGALATGTHGYGREGGVMSELVRGATLVLADGRSVEIRDERDLRAVRLGLGTLGAVASLTLAIEKKGPCRFEVACLPREEFVRRLDELACAHEYLRYVPHPFDARSMFYMTIDRLPADAPSTPARYIDDRPPGALGLLVPALRLAPVRTLIGRVLRVGGYGYRLQIPFSSLLFLSAGVVRSHPGLARVGQLALEHHDWLNMELAVPRESYPEFERLFAELRPRLSPLSPAQPYYTCRVVGRAGNVLLAPNYERDVVFCDVHADPAQPASRAFLETLEARAVRELAARPHWGKVFFAEKDVVRGLYPRENVAAFLECKRRFDPAGVFSNAYTRRVLGV
ncbi:MAG TPA: SDR family NAD(P)-dependent oxidoreductase [Vicinamibacteria bacterium]|nr:SDR family NAD(P)-dependent oxidoreductase [Vicinamibacteria bacterium]